MIMKWSLTTGLIFVLCIDLFLFLGQTALLEVNPDATQFINYQTGLIGSPEAGNNILTTNISEQLPTITGSISPTTGNLFTDSISVLSNWVSGAFMGITILTNVITAPNSFLNAIGLPTELSFALAAMWFILHIFLFTAFLMGRQT